MQYPQDSKTWYISSMNPSQVKIEASWKEALKEEFSKAYFGTIKEKIIADKSAGKKVYPPGPLIFNAFNLTPLEQVKVVILGQDPYHKPGEAMGLSFSVPQGVRTPPSLVNIYKEINRDIGHDIPPHGDLTSWAQQGVLLINSMLTVVERSPGSHKSIGWQEFTDAVIRRLSDLREGVIFLLWGRFAQGKAPLIDKSKHHVLMAAHPSPLARNAFSGCSHFSKTNELLINQGKSPINWQIQ